MRQCNETNFRIHIDFFWFFFSSLKCHYCHWNIIVRSTFISRQRVHIVTFNHLLMSKTSNDILIESLENISFEETTEKMSLDSIVLMEDEEELLKSRGNSPVKQPSNADLMKIMLEISANTADNNKFKAAASKRLVILEQRADKVDKRIENLETIFEEFKSAGSQTPSSANDWLDQRKLRNNVSIVGIPPTKNENIEQIVVDLCGALGIVIATGDLNSVYRVAHAKSNMLIAKFNTFELKSRLLAAKGKKRLTAGEIPNVACSSGYATNPIFINSHVTPIIGRMLHCGRMAVKEKKILACWVTSKGFMVKVKNDCEPKVLHTLEELNCFVGVLESLPVQPVPSTVQTGKRNKPENDSLSPVDNKSKSKQRNTSRGKSSVGPLSSKAKANKEQK